MMLMNPILLVDDDPFLGPVTVELLGELGHPTIWAADLRSAWALLDGPLIFTAILLDLQVGAERGETLFDDMSDRPLPPIIIFSAQSLAEVLLAAEHVHASAVLEKPCGAQDIVAALDAISRSSVPADPGHQ